MNLNKASKRYAKALLALALEQNVLSEVKADIDLLTQTLDSSRDFRVLVNSQVVQEDKKATIYKKLLGGKISDLSLKFFLLVAKNHRSTIIPFICSSFTEVYKKHMKIFPVSIISAHKLDEDIKQRLIELLKKGDVNEVELNEQIDESLIGGFIIKSEDRQIDASVAHQLTELKREIRQSGIATNL